MKIQLTHLSGEWIFGIKEGIDTYEDDQFIISNSNSGWHGLGFFKGESFFRSLLYIVCVVAEKHNISLPYYINKCVLDLITKGIDKTADYHIFGYGFFTIFRSAHNPLVIDFVKNLSGEKYLYFIDPIGCKQLPKESKHVKQIFKLINDNLFDNVFSYEYNTAKEFNFNFLPFMCCFETKMQEIEKSVNNLKITHPKYFAKIKSDVAIISNAPKHKLLHIGKCIDSFIKNDIRFLCNVTGIAGGGSDSEICAAKCIQNANNIDDLRNYKNIMNGNGNIINRIFNTNAVLCISAEFDYVSITIIEALYFGKKIMTDAKSLYKSELYDPELIRIIDPFNITSEDVSWLKTNTINNLNKIVARNRNYLTINNYFNRFIQNKRSYHV